MSHAPSPVPPPWSLHAPAPTHEGAETARLGRLFEFGNQVNPNKIAIDDGKTSYTFQALEALACRLATTFQARGVSPGDHVVVVADKRAIMPAIACAIWKCGAVYIPVDGTSPVARLDRLYQRLNPSLVVCCKDMAPPDDYPTLSLGALEALSEETGAVPAFSSVPIHMDKLAYILFTSGSTGEPKGVEITVESLLAYFQAHNEVLQFTEDSRVFSLTPFHFDVSIEDTLLPLSLGAFVYQFRGIVVPPIIQRVLQKQHITHLIAVSTVLTLISQPREIITAATFPDLTMVMTGAEVCDPDIINLWTANLPGCRVINAYGPTEATIVCTCHVIEQAQWGRNTTFPIGTPLSGVHVLVLREDGTVADVGESGELCIGGVQVMRGYFNQPDETAKAIFERDAVRYYRTGDICHTQPDGLISFVGRNDDEVKIAGRRIHLGEIRQKAMSFKGVERVAIKTLDRHNKREIAVVVVSPDQSIIADVKAYLADHLPPYMRPTVWGHATKVALSSTGKTNERVLLSNLCKHATTSRRSSFTISDDGEVSTFTEG